MPDRTLLYPVSIGALIALIATLGVLATILGTGDVPRPDGGGMITAAAIERAGATMRPTVAEE